MAPPFQLGFSQRHAIRGDEIKNRPPDNRFDAIIT